MIQNDKINIENVLFKFSVGNQEIYKAGHELSARIKHLVLPLFADREEPKKHEWVLINISIRECDKVSNVIKYFFEQEECDYLSGEIVLEIKEDSKIRPEPKPREIRQRLLEIKEDVDSEIQILKMQISEQEYLWNPENVSLDNEDGEDTKKFGNFLEFLHKHPEWILRADQKHVMKLLDLCFLTLKKLGLENDEEIIKIFQDVMDYYFENEKFLSIVNLISHYSKKHQFEDLCGFIFHLKEYLKFLDETKSINLWDAENVNKESKDRENFHRFIEALTKAPSVLLNGSDDSPFISKFFESLSMLSIEDEETLMLLDKLVKACRVQDKYFIVLHLLMKKICKSHPWWKDRCINVVISGMNSLLCFSDNIKNDWKKIEGNTWKSLQDNWDRLTCNSFLFEENPKEYFKICEKFLSGVFKQAGKRECHHLQWHLLKFACENIEMLPSNNILLNIDKRQILAQKVYKNQEEQTLYGLAKKMNALDLRPSLIYKSSTDTLKISVDIHCPFKSCEDLHDFAILVRQYNIKNLRVKETISEEMCEFILSQWKNLSTEDRKVFRPLLKSFGFEAPSKKKILSTFELSDDWKFKVRML